VNLDWSHSTLLAYTDVRLPAGQPTLALSWKAQRFNTFFFFLVEMIQHCFFFVTTTRGKKRLDPGQASSELGMKRELGSKSDHNVGQTGGCLVGKIFSETLL
jgi:hypothetical protein